MTRPDQARPVVVLVDDDAALAHALDFSFGLEGLEVHAYADAEALLEARDYPERGCLVLDHQLPGMDGLSLLLHLRASGVGLPAIMVTTNPSRTLRARAAACGAPIVEKPLLSDALLKAVRHALEAPL